ncbi:MAG: MFS transporter [Candidatus Dadabacteria bacterium]|nr:MFS transporter [Candidatus Dadabacteria bacterium]NIS08981.1 MFS transporter [Candidatus Dadabacteria bacterium]NIV41024.1 MFS transporter [Candidatus Dadabacteria bacterium]NIX15583.1 MFS transporter [Candidatus Dadabacteria bacterium]NIY22324.1 MFS transporter [Candidatus Dadabacteria bacterium]
MSKISAFDDKKEYRKKIISWCMYDWANSAFATTVMAAVLPVYYSKVAGAGLQGNTATVYWGYTTAIALLITAFIAPIMGAIADFSKIKKRMLMIFASLGILFTSLLYLVNTGDWFIASLFFIFGNVGFATSEVFYNSLLPEVAKPEDIDRVSTRGYALGYLGGGILLAINVAMLKFIDDKKFASRLCFITVGIWWTVFTIPLITNIKETSRKNTIGSKFNSFYVGFRRVGKTFRELKNYRELLLFLAAFWIYNDGIGTIIKMATIYGAEIGIGTNDLIGALLLTQFVGIPFAILFGRLAGVIGAKRSIYLGLFVYTLISIGAYFMTKGIHFWILAFSVALVQGGTQALSRSLFASMVPSKKAAEFFGFYGMSSKFAGIFGPLIFAVVGQITGTSRLSIVSLVAFFIIGAFVLSRVDVNKGIENAHNI